MLVFFLQFFAFFFSLLVINHGVNQLILKHFGLESRFLPVFAWGWCFYFFIYILGRRLGTPVEPIRMMFATIAFSVAMTGGVWWILQPQRSFWQERKQDLPLDRVTIVFLLCFLVAMIYIGPYLEHPSDSVDYFYRIQTWEKARFMHYRTDSRYVTFATFYEHWLLQPSALSYGKRLGLSFVSAITQGILLWEMIRVARLIVNNVPVSLFAGLMSLGYFGYDAISFYRYGVFSGPMMAYIIYLETLVLIIALFLKEQWRYLLFLPPLLWLTWDNHEQSTLFQAIAIAAISTTLVLFRYRSLKPQFRRVLIGAIALCLLGTIFLCCWREPLTKNLDLEYQDLYIFNIETLFGWKMYVIRYTPLSHAIGLVGWLTAIASIVFLLFGKPARKLDMMAGLTLFPFLIFCNPLILEALRRVMAVEQFHRLLYGCLFWMFPVLLLHHFSGKLERFFSRISLLTKVFSRYIHYILISLLIFASLLPRDPIYGKMIHSWLKIPQILDGSDLQPVIQYLRDNAEKQCNDPYPNENYYPIRRYILSDPYVNTYLSGTGYFYTNTHRWDNEFSQYAVPLGISTQLDTNIDYPQFMQLLQEKKVCYIVIYLPKKQVTSWLGKVSGHWYDTYAHTQRHYSPTFLKWVRESPQDFQLVFEEEGIQIFQVNY
ncbi:MAG: hypothetical protein J7647_14520 [Cyanobacteria bacterium SBLK]|nr:hypothetical protein [Cyanobacteria bacterium SBLK]